MQAIEQSTAMIEFEPSGIIRTAKDIFLSAMGYELREVLDQYHRMFVDDAFGASAEYAAF